MKKVEISTFATLNCRTVGLFTASLLLAAGMARANTLYWDQDATDAGNNLVSGRGLGGSGGWNVSSANWWTGSGADTSWNNANNDTASFWGTNTAPVVTLGSGITVGGLTFNTTGYTLDAGANTLTFGAADNIILFHGIVAATNAGAVAGPGRNVTLTGGTHGGIVSGTLSLIGTSTNGWSGTTAIGNGMTLALSQANQALLDTTSITLNGGGLTLISADLVEERTLDRANNSAPITVIGGGTLSYDDTTINSSFSSFETLGPITVNSGQFALTQARLRTGGTGGQTLTVGNLTRSGSSSVLFSSGLNKTTRNIIVVSGASATPANEIVGPWATIGNSAILQSDYAIYLGGGTGELRNATATTGDLTWNITWAATANYNFANSSNGAPLTATRNLNTLRHSSVNAETLDLANFNLGTYGLLNGAAGALTITDSTGSGVVTLPTTTAGKLYVTTGSGAITMAAPITDNTGALTLVKSGAGGTLTLSGNNTFSGGLEINAGTVAISSTNNLGTGGITFNGNGTLSSTGQLANISRPIALSNGALATLNPAAASGAVNEFSGEITGTGGLILYDVQSWFLLSNLGNTFEGPVQIKGASTVTSLEIASLADSASADGTIQMWGATTSVIPTFRWSALATNALVLNHRQFDLYHPTAVTIFVIENSNATHTITINTDLIVSPTTCTFGKTLSLQGINTGANTFAGRIADGGLGTVALSKAGAGTWVLSGSNTYSGSTTISGGILCFGNKAARTSSIFTNSTAGAATGLGVGDAGAGYYDATDVANLFNNTLSGFELGTTAGVAIDTTAGDFNYATGISANRSLYKIGANTLILSGSNTGTGKTFVVSGTLQFAKQMSLYNNTTALWTTNKITVARGATLAFNVGGVDEFTSANLDTLQAKLKSVNTNGFLAGSALGLDTSNAGGSFTYTNVLTDSTGTGGGAVGVVKLGAGTLVLTGSNTFTGVTTVKAGLLGGNGAIGGKLLVASGAGVVAQVGSVLKVQGDVDLTAAGDTLVVEGVEPTGRTVIIRYTGTLVGDAHFDTVQGWPVDRVDYSIPGEIALKVSDGGIMTLVE